jgi:hypothetical protein
MPSSEQRQRLAVEQAGLMRALAGQADAPAGFDAARVRVAADSLLSKRMQSVARTWPVLAESLGDRYAEHFRAYGTRHALPSEGGPLADGYAFARHLQSERLFPGAARGELLTVQLRYRATARGLVRRRGPVVRLALFRRPFRLILAIRLPWLGERLLRLA